MLGYIDWIIIVIALIMTAVGLWFLFSPQSGSQEATQQLRILRLQAENDRKHIAETLEITQNGVRDAESLLGQLKQQIEQAGRSYQAGQARAEQAERIIERVSSAEHEIRDISSQLGDRLQHLQSYWDEQLGDSVESVKRIRAKLHEGLTQVDDSISRLREQEKMALGFTRRLIEHHHEQVTNQQENSRLSAEVHTRLEQMLQESSHLLDQMKRYQQDADAVFQQFSTSMEGLETRASEHFNTLFQNTELARHELKTGLDESRQHVETMRRREEQSNELSRKIHEQFEQIDNIRVERIAKTLDLTEQMSSDLHKGMENARDLLSSLEQAVHGITASLHTKTSPNQKDADHAPVMSTPTLAAPIAESTPVTEVPASQPVAESVASEPLPAESSSDLPTERLEPTNDVHKVDNLVSLRAYRGS